MTKNPIGYDCQTFTKMYKMTVDPVKLVGFIEALLFGILFLHLFLLYLYEDCFDVVSSANPQYLVTAMIFIHFAFKHLQKRIETLEEKLDGQPSHQTLRREHKMKITPIKLVGFSLVLLFGALLYNLFLLYQSRDEGHFDIVLPMVLPLLYLVTAMIFIHLAFRHLQKRIDALEEKLNEKDKPKD